MLTFFLNQAATGERMLSLSRPKRIQTKNPAPQRKIRFKKPISMNGIVGRKSCWKARWGGGTEAVWLLRKSEDSSSATKSKADSDSPEGLIKVLQKNFSFSSSIFQKEKISSRTSNGGAYLSESI